MTRENGGKIDLFFARLAFELCLCLTERERQSEMSNLLLDDMIIFFLQTEEIENINSPN